MKVSVCLKGLGEEMERKFIITAESTCDLTSNILKELNIPIISMYVNIEDVSYKDGVDIHPDMIFSTFETKGILAKTSAIPMYDYKLFFEKYIEQNYEIIHISLGSKFSSTYQAAVNAANLLDDVTVIDSSNLSTGYGHIVMLAAELVKGNKGLEEITEELYDFIPKVRASFVIDTLNYLHKGGRCSSVAALGANLLQLKPCIEVVDGEMKVGKKYRGYIERSLKSYIEDKLSDLKGIHPKRIFITHSGCNDGLINMVKDTIKKKDFFQEIIITQAGCTISCHCGPNTLGILYYTV